MKPAAFRYEAPTTLKDALRLIDAHADDGKILAGGQSLVPAMNFRLARPSVLVDINNVAELRFVHETDHNLEFGSVTRHAQFHKPICAGPLGRMLVKVVRNIAHYPIRQRGTFGGSLSHADSASEWCLVSATLEAVMTINSSTASREVPASRFFRGTFVTDIKPNEILSRIRLPKLPDGWGTGFFEFSRRKGDFALSMALAALRLEDGMVADARIGIGAVADHGKRMVELEAAVIGKRAEDEVFAEIGRLASDVVNPSSDIHGSSDYRKDLTATVVMRALREAAADARQFAC